MNLQAAPFRYRPAGLRISRFPSGLLRLALVLALLAGCASRPFQGNEVASSPFLQRAQSQQQGNLRVSAAVPDAHETRQLTGLDLYEQGIQPIWLHIENSGPAEVRAALWSVDKDYYSPIEVAYMNRGGFGDAGYRAMERWFLENGMPRIIPPGESRSGLVFAHLLPGTRGFNLDIIGNRQATSFTFFVPIPGFEADYMAVDFASLYAPDEWRQVDENELPRVLREELPCCSVEQTGTRTGGPLNAVLVGTPLAVRRSLLRGGWRETSLDDEVVLGARAHYFRGRPPDTVFYQSRADGTERLQLQLWLTPWRVGPDAVWAAMVFYRLEKSLLLVPPPNTPKLLRAFLGENISADVDTARHYLVQNFWYNYSLAKMGVLPGVGTATIESPRQTFDGFGFITDGRRVVLFLSETPVALGDTRIIYTEALADSVGAGP